MTTSDGLPLLAKWETVSGRFGGLSHRPLEPLAGRCVAQVEPSLHAPAVRVPETPPLAHLKHTRAGYSFWREHLRLGILRLLRSLLRVPETPRLRRTQAGFSSLANDAQGVTTT